MERFSIFSCDEISFRERYIFIKISFNIWTWKYIVDFSGYCFESSFNLYFARLSFDCILFCYFSELKLEVVWMGGRKNNAKMQWKSCQGKYFDVDYNSFQSSAKFRRDYMALKLFKGSPYFMTECKANFRYPVICESKLLC